MFYGSISGGRGELMLVRSVWDLKLLGRRKRFNFVIRQVSNAAKKKKMQNILFDVISKHYRLSCENRNGLYVSLISVSLWYIYFLPVFLVEVVLFLLLLRLIFIITIILSLQSVVWKAENISQMFTAVHFTDRKRRTWYLLDI